MRVTRLTTNTKKELATAEAMQSNATDGGTLWFKTQGEKNNPNRDHGRPAGLEHFTVHLSWHEVSSALLRMQAGQIADNLGGDLGQAIKRYTDALETIRLALGAPKVEPEEEASDAVGA